MRPFSEQTSTTAETAIAALAEQLASVDAHAECHVLSQKLFSASRAAAEANVPDWPKVKALWLVAAACSMMLVPQSTNEPFKPMFVMADGSRSAVAEDFSPEDALLFSQVAEASTRCELRARLSDVAWICSQPKNVADARRAIDAYVSVQPTESDWTRLQDDWERAITLCMQLRQGAEDRQGKIEHALKRIVNTSLASGESLGLAAARILFQRQLAQDEGENFAEMLAKQGEALVVAAGDFHRARTYLDLASQWFTRLGNAHRAADMMLSAGLSWETQADRRTGTDPNGRNLAEALFLEDAIQTLRKIPKEQRPSLGVDQHLARLLQRLPESGRQAIRSMTTISSGPVDITEFVRQSEQAVSGKTPLDALLTFVHLHPGARHSKLVEDAKEMMRQFPLSTMFAASIYGRDGRVIAKTPGGQYGAQADDADTRLYASVLRDLLRDMDLVCKAQLLPALMTIRNEHSVRRADLSHLLSLAPVVPPGRAEQFSKGLWEGFELDFATAIYILAPQVEHLVRWHLKEAGVTTTVVDREGIENETGLSSLVNLPEVNKIFGEDCAFELKALFCSPFGPNLRNEVAHGLLGENECHTTDIVYAWWWVLRLTLRSFLQANRPVDPVPTSGSGA